MNRLHIEILAAFGLLVADLLPAHARSERCWSAAGRQARATTCDDMRLAGIPVSGLNETIAFRRGP